MIRAADAIESVIDGLDQSDRELFEQLVRDHLPEVLLEAAGDRLWTETPRRYLTGIMAKSLSARIVYREGYEALEAMDLTAIADLAIKYLRLEQERRRLVDEVAASSLPNRDRIIRLLRRAGILSTIDDQDGWGDSAR